MNKASLVKKAYSLGFAYEKKYRGCSQCTLAAIQDTLGIRNDFVFKAIYITRSRNTRYLELKIRSLENKYLLTVLYLSKWKTCLREY